MGKKDLVIIRKPVDSSNITEVGYDEQSRTLEIAFKNQRVYRYTPVTLEGYNLFLNADSLGSYFYKNIRSNEAITAEEQ